jgi:uncharacterized membrane protein
MVKSRFLHLFLGLILVFSVVSGLCLMQFAVSAQEATPTPTTTPIPDVLELACTYPALYANSGESYSFDVDIKYSGKQQTFNLNATGPQGWDITVSSGGKQASSVTLGPVDYTTTNSVTIYMSSTLPKPEPGSYIAKFTVSSASLKQEIQLTANVKAKYGFSLSTESGNLNPRATAGKDNIVTLKVYNSGTAAIDKLQFTSTKPEGWVISFKPSDTIDTIAGGETKTIEAVINPPGGKTVAGDYEISINATNGTYSQDIILRLTVLTPTIWGWVGIIIVVVVIAGLAVLFMKLGRR